MTPRRPRRIRRAAILSVAVTLLATGIAAGAARHHTGHRAAKHRLAHAQSRAHAADSGYSALLREATAADAENADIVGAAREDEGLQPAQARLLDASAAGRTWLIPTNRDELCLGVQPAGQYEELERKRGLDHLSLAYACSPTAAAGTRGIVVRIYDEVVGIVPDGVTSVAASVAGGAPSQDAVAHNTYRFSVPDGFQEGSISFQDRDGTQQVDQL